LSEWLPPDPSTFLGGRFYAALILTSLLLLSVFRRVRPSEILLFAAFSLLAIKSQRMIVWWGMVSAPLLCRWLLLWKPSLALPPRVRTSHHRLGQLMLGFWVLLFFAGWPTRHSPQLDSRGDYRGLDKDTPVETATFLLQHTRPGEPQRLFHRLEWGSYFMWRLWPSFQTFIDIRVWIFDDEHWNAVLSAGRAEPGWQDLLDRYQITWLALSLETQKPLIDAVLQDPRWVERHRDGLGVVFERRP
jgi:hypothetical protein